MSTGKRTVLITGTSDGGLGSALAIAFHKAGWRVLATARNITKMKAVQNEGVETLALDVQSPSSLQEAVTQVSKMTGGHLDALVNNAGGGYSMPYTDIDVVEAKALFDLNVWSLVSTTQAFLPLLLKSKAAMIINNTSIASVLPFPLQSVYNASKAAAASMTDSLRLELAPFGIKVIDLKTGAVKTNFFSNIKANDHSRHIPTDSIYQVAKEAVESTMDGEKFFEGTETAEDWAAHVVKDLGRKSPPSQIWRGTGAGKAWVITSLPHGMADGAIKSMTGLDKVEQGFKAQRAVKA